MDRKEQRARVGDLIRDLFIGRDGRTPTLGGTVDAIMGLIPVVTVHPREEAPLLMIAQDVWMRSNGSFCDPGWAEDQARDVAILRKRLVGWRPSIPGCEARDALVRSLVEYAVAETNRTAPAAAIFARTLWARRPDGTEECNTGCLTAEDEPAAQEAALHFARGRWPEAEGWTSHRAQVCRVPAEWYTVGTQEQRSGVLRWATAALDRAESMPLEQMNDVAFLAAAVRWLLGEGDAPTTGVR